jgi:hypothetical protein
MLITRGFLLCWQTNKLSSFYSLAASVLDDKIILRFDRNNKPITNFATYFEINQNRLKTVANNQKQRAFSEQGKLQYTSGSKRLRKHCNSQNNLLKFVS